VVLPVLLGGAFLAFLLSSIDIGSFLFSSRGFDLRGSLGLLRLIAPVSVPPGPMVS
jgi:hypothetical protein